MSFLFHTSGSEGGLGGHPPRPTRRARSRLRVGPHALAQRMLEGLLYRAILLLLLLLVLFAILLLLLLLLLVLFLILLFIFLLCASRLSTRQSKVDGTLAGAAFQLAPGGLNDPVHSEAEFLEQVLERGRGAEGSHADARAVLAHELGPAEG